MSVDNGFKNYSVKLGSGDEAKVYVNPLITPDNIERGRIKREIEKFKEDKELDKLLLDELGE